MADFNFVTARLATGGGIVSSEDVRQLAAAGITAVVDCRKEFDDALLLASHPDIAYLWDGTDDDGKPKSAEWFDKGVKFALAALSRPHEKVYCHCAAGVNRGPSMAYCVLRCLGLTPVQAEGLIRSARPQVGLAYKTDADRAVVELGYS